MINDTFLIHMVTYIIRYRELYFTLYPCLKAYLTRSSNSPSPMYPSPLASARWSAHQARQHGRCESRRWKPALSSSLLRRPSLSLSHPPNVAFICSFVKGTFTLHLGTISGMLSLTILFLRSLSLYNRGL